MNADNLYRVVARARAIRWGYDKTLDPADYERLVERYAADYNLRADVNVVLAALPDDADRDCHAPVKDGHLHSTFPVGRQVRA